MLEVKNLSKNYGDVKAVDDLSFSIDQGEFVTLLGPSGCGKSTTLHSIAGLVSPSKGTIHLRGEEITHLSPSERNIGMAFQHTALFPHMTATENIAYGLKMHGYTEDEVDARVQELLELVQMPEYSDHNPGELSGGQQQRVSLARAIAYKPDILLLDEPLTGLDRVLREEMRHEIMRIQEEVDVTTLYVTHDQEEALSMSDKVVVLKDGLKQQEGTPQEIYQKPTNTFVAEFVGKSTKFEGEVVEMSPLTADTGTFHIQFEAEEVRRDQSVTLYVRPSDVTVETEADSREDGAVAAGGEVANLRHQTQQIVENELHGTVSEVTNLGSRAETIVTLADGTEMLVEMDRFPDIASGERVSVQFPSSEVVAL